MTALLGEEGAVSSGYLKAMLLVVELICQERRDLFFSYILINYIQFGHS